MAIMAKAEHSSTRNNWKINRKSRLMAILYTLMAYFSLFGGLFRSCAKNRQIANVRRFAMKPLQVSFIFWDCAWRDRRRIYELHWSDAVDVERHMAFKLDRVYDRQIEEPRNVMPIDFKYAYLDPAVFAEPPFFPCFASVDNLNEVLWRQGTFQGRVRRCSSLLFSRSYAGFIHSISSGILLPHFARKCNVA